MLAKTDSYGWLARKWNGNLHEEVAEGARVGSGGADQVVEICSERHAYAGGRSDVYAVTLPVAVGAEEDAQVGTLGERRGGRCREGSGEESEAGCEEGGELHGCFYWSFSLAVWVDEEAKTNDYIYVYYEPFLFSRASITHCVQRGVWTAVYLCLQDITSLYTYHFCTVAYQQTTVPVQNAVNIVATTELILGAKDQKFELARLW